VFLVAVTSKIYTAVHVFEVQAKFEKAWIVIDQRNHVLNCNLDKGVSRIGFRIWSRLVQQDLGNLNKDRAHACSFDQQLLNLTTQPLNLFTAIVAFSSKHSSGSDSPLITQNRLTKTKLGCC